MQWRHWLGPQRRFLAALMRAFREEHACGIKSWQTTLMVDFLISGDAHVLDSTLLRTRHMCTCGDVASFVKQSVALHGTTAELGHGALCCA